MRRTSICIALALATALASGLPVTSVRSEDAKGQPSGATCQGTDMLAEFATTDPGLYARVMDEARKLENSEALLWKIEKPGLAPSYLFGTVHLSDPRVTAMPEKVKAALGDVKSFALEVADLSDVAMAKAMSDAAPLLIYADGHMLSEKLTADEFKQVQSLVGKSGMPAEMAGLLKPWIVNMLLAVSECERQQLAAGTQVLDMRLAEEAKKLGLTVSGLETIGQQLASLAEVPDDQQIQMLKSGLKYANRTNDMMETLIQLYLKHQLGAAMPFQLALAAKSGTPATAFDGLNKSLLVDRNIRMREGMTAMFEKGPAFIAVGALHLPGKTGIVALLKEAGYTLTPVE